uniref:Uncharacterized protein n=1 Tax=Sparus aurata TaxID=8175 RepID=A0A671VT92_SPAAU
FFFKVYSLGSAKARPRRRDGEERAEQQPRMELNNRREDRTVGKGPRTHARQAALKTPPLRERFGKRSARNHPPYSGLALHHNLSSCSFPPLAKNRLSPFAWTHVASAFYSTMLAGTRGHS